MKETSIGKDHCVPHTRKNGVKVMVTREHAKRLYHAGDMPPNYQMPAIRYIVVNYASGDCIEIRSWKNNPRKSLIDCIFWKPV